MGCLTSLSDDKCIMGFLSLVPPTLLMIVLTPNAVLTCNRLRKLKRTMDNNKDHFKGTSNDCSKVKETNLWGHELRWLIFTALMLMNILLLLESCMSAIKYYLVTDRLVYVFIFSDILNICAFVIIMIVYTFVIEFYKQFRFIWIIWIYWMLIIICNVGRIVMLSYSQNSHLHSAAFVLVVISLILYILLFLLDSYIIANKKFTSDVQERKDRISEDIKYIYPFVTLPSKATFHWLNGLLRQGYKTPLQGEHLGKLPSEECSKENFTRFKKAFENEKIRAKKKNIPPSLWRCYFKVFWPGMLIALICHLVSGNAMFLGPIFLSRIVDYVMECLSRKDELHVANETSVIWMFDKVKDNVNSTSNVEFFISIEEFFSNGYVLAVIMCMASLIEGYTNQNYLFLASRQGTRLKGTIQAMVYDKTLRLPSQFTSDGDMSQGQILNHMSVDPMHLFMLFSMGLMAIGIPMQVCIGFVYLYMQLGVSSLLGAGLIISTCPLQYLIGKRMATIQKHVLDKADERIKKANETLQSIKLLKLYAWEKTFCKSILRSRHKEVVLLLKVGLYRVLSLCLTDGSPLIACVLCFSVYPYIEKKPLSPGKVFAAYAIIILLNVCLFLTPMVINIIAHAVVSTRRLQKFLTTEEIQSNQRLHICNDNSENDANLKENDMYATKLKDDSSRTNRYDEQVKNGQKQKKEHCKPSSETEPLKSSYNDINPDNTSVTLEEDIVVKVQNGGFSWKSSNNDDLILKDLNLQIKQGCLTMVVGSVGSGKSSLLYALLGEMNRHRGTVTWKSNVSIAYGAQKAWLLNASLRENIIFGKDFDAKLYNTVIKACALQPDIEMLVAGDLTEIGEKGINLSGGQKQRVSMARAMYSNANVILLDDPFSALDAHVGSHIFEHAIQNLLLQQKKTIVLVTHQLQYLPQAHKILVMKDGILTLEGTYEELERTNPEIFRVIQEEHAEEVKEGHEVASVQGQLSPDLIRKGNNSNQHEENNLSLSKSLQNVHTGKDSPSLKQRPNQLFLSKTQSREFLAASVASLTKTSSKDLSRHSSHHIASALHYHMGAVRSASSITSLTHVDVDADYDDLRKHYLKTQLSKSADTLKIIPSEKSISSLPTVGGKPLDLVEESGKLIEDEERATGSVSWRIYCRYAKAASWFLVIATLMGYILNTLVLRMIKDMWLASWSQASIDAEQKLLKENNRNMSINDAYNLQYYINGFLGLSFAGVLLLFLQVLALEFMALNASRNLHRDMVKTITKAPMRFFDVTPVGRIINRMSGDTNILDEKMSVTTDGVLYCLMFILGGILMNSISTPVFIVPAVVMLIIFLLVQRYYVASSRELQRLDSISKSPILAHFSETLGGLTTLRAYGHEKRFQCKNWEHVDVNNTAFNFFHAANAWVGVRLDIIGAFIVFSSAICTITSGILGNIEPSIVSIGIIYAVSCRSFMTWFMRCLSEFEIYLNAAERICYYNDIKPEIDYKLGKAPDDWPLEGCIKFEKTSLRYDATLSKVVKGVDLYMKPRQKIGICGRTGSGKSSLTLGIFNMIDICQGHIFIDGVDIKKVPLHDLRSRLAIIPQDPVLFYGTVRYNLDPESRHSEPEIWRSLEIAQLMPLICSLQGRLDAMVSEGGENFSVGQRQLFCLARAFLRNAKILVMDEPTASVDMNTDAIIQEVTQSVFTDKTIVTIAHRVATIVNYDWIIVLDKGKVIEEGSPSNLIRRGGSFAGMVKKNQ